MVAKNWGKNYISVNKKLCFPSCWITNLATWQFTAMLSPGSSTIQWFPISLIPKLSTAMSTKFNFVHTLAYSYRKSSKVCISCKLNVAAISSSTTYLNAKNIQFRTEYLLLQKTKNYIIATHSIIRFPNHTTLKMQLHLGSHQNSSLQKHPYRSARIQDQNKLLD